MFIAEGVREVERALAAGLVARQVFHAPELLPGWTHGGEGGEVVRARPRQAGPTATSRRACSRSSRRRLATCHPGATLLVVAVGLEKPGNLGAIARSADAAGADGILVADGEVDPWNPNAIRASTGSVFFTLPIVEATRHRRWRSSHSRRSPRCWARGPAPQRRQPDETDRVPDRSGGPRARRRVARCRRRAGRDPDERSGGGLAERERRRRCIALRGSRASARAPPLAGEPSASRSRRRGRRRS